MKGVENYFVDQFYKSERWLVMNKSYQSPHFNKSTWRRMAGTGGGCNWECT